jgi:hypothetical protein
MSTKRRLGTLSELNKPLTGSPEGFGNWDGSKNWPK